MATGLDSLRAWLRPAAHGLVNIAVEAGLQPLVSSARRSRAQQALLYRRFLAGQSTFPAAPPGHSTHELGLAFDLEINDHSQYADLGKVWEAAGGVWGGHFKDPIHFEAGGVTARHALAIVHSEASGTPVEGPAFYKLADFLSGFVPFLGPLQLAESLATLLDHNQDKAGWYLQHPAEAIRDLLS